MRGRVSRGPRVDKIDHRIVVLNWLRRRGVVEKEKEVKKEKCQEDEQS